MTFMIHISLFQVADSLMTPYYKMGREPVYRRRTRIGTVPFDQSISNGSGLIALESANSKAGPYASVASSRWLSSSAKCIRRQI
jgi:hypothetical protein